MEFEEPKGLVQEFWENDGCGEQLYLQSLDKLSFQAHEKTRYELEPYILDFAEFDKYKDKNVLEIGVGLGAEHKRFAEAGAVCSGIDLTEKAIDITSKRLSEFGFRSNLSVGDAENIDYPSDYFDLAYSWGVIHHSPNTERAASEIMRVLKPGGSFKVMIYNKYSMVGYMLWVRYGLLAFKPRMSLDEIYAKYLESPGTKAYTPAQAKQLFADAEQLDISIELTHGDLLESSAGQRHEGVLLSIARLVWPRKLIGKFFPEHGLFMLIQGQKPMNELSYSTSRR